MDCNIGNVSFNLNKVTYFHKDFSLTATDCQLTDESFFGLMFYVLLPVNSYGHVETVSSPNHTFSWASLTKLSTSTSCTHLRL